MHLLSHGCDCLYIRTYFDENSYLLLCVLINYSYIQSIVIGGGKLQYGTARNVDFSVDCIMIFIEDCG